MVDLLKLANETQDRAWDVIQKTRILEAWGFIGSEVNLVGSLRTGLLSKNLDIDFHVYTSPFVLVDSFKAISIIAEVAGVKQIKYKNLLNTGEKCLEWHAWYRDQEGQTWQIDMVHIHPGSPFVGVFERIADRINAALTLETRQAILGIKHAAPEGVIVKGIEVCMAVIRDGARNYDDFVAWKRDQDLDGIIEWEP